MSYAKRDFLPDPYIHLSEGSGKFWDSESDSDYEDLGDAKVLAQAVQPNLRPAPAAISAVPPQPAVAVRPSPAAFSTAAPRPAVDVKTKVSSSSPRRIQAPWKRIWKGPLPPRRITPATTIGDFLIPALVSSAQGSRCRDPVSTEFRNSKNRRGHGSSGPKQLTYPVESNRVTSHPTQPPGAEEGTEFGKPRRRIINPTAFHAIHTSPPTPPTTPADSFAKPNRRLVSPIVVHHPISYTAALTPPTPTTPISYAAAVMAGGHGGRRGAPAGQRAHRGRGAHPGRHPHGQGAAGREDALAAEVHAPLPNRDGGRGSGRGVPAVEHAPPQGNLQRRPRLGASLAA